MTKELVEFRPGVFAREGEQTLCQYGWPHTFHDGRWVLSSLRSARTGPGTASPELLSFEVTTMIRVNKRAYGWEWPR